MILRKSNWIADLLVMFVICISLVTMQLGCSKSEKDSKSAEATIKKGTDTIFKSWDRTSETGILLKKFVEEYGLPLKPKSIWVKDNDKDVYFLLEIPDLAKTLSTIKGPKIFLNLYIDSDSNPLTGVQNMDIGGVNVSGFDFDISFSVMVYVDPVKSVIICRVQKWDQERETFSGKLEWCTNFNKSFTEKTEGDFVQLSIPRSILEIGRNVKNIRVAFALPESKYISGFDPITTLIMKK